MLGERVDEGAQRSARDVGPRWVVRVADIDEARLRRNRSEQRIKVMRVIGRQWHLDRVGLLLLSRQGIRDERGPGKDNVVSRLEERGCEVADRHVCAGARGDHVGCETMGVGERGVERTRVGIAVELGRLSGDRRECGGRRAFGSLIRRELDDGHPFGHAARRAGRVNSQVAHEWA